MTGRAAAMVAEREESRVRERDPKKLGAGGLICPARHTKQDKFGDMPVTHVKNSLARQEYCVMSIRHVN